jgi:hypothetical protein
VERAAKALSRALYLQRRKERAVQIAGRNNYPVLQLQNLELLLEENMASHAKHVWSVLQSSFTAPKFSASVGDALNQVTIWIYKHDVEIDYTFRPSSWRNCIWAQEIQTRQND